MTFAPTNPTCPPASLACDCCAQGYSKTLYLTFTSADCPSLNGLVITIVNTSDNCAGLTLWTGSGSAGGCDFDVEVWIAVNVCVWRLNLIGDCSAGPINIGPATCPFTMQSTVKKFNCDCCDRENVTITLTE